MAPTSDDPFLFPDLAGPPAGVIAINERCRLQEREGYRVVSVCGLPLAHFAVGRPGGRGLRDGEPGRSGLGAPGRGGAGLRLRRAHGAAAPAAVRRGRSGGPGAARGFPRGSVSGVAEPRGGGESMEGRGGVESGDRPAAGRRREGGAQARPASGLAGALGRARGPALRGRGPKPVRSGRAGRCRSPANRGAGGRDRGRPRGPKPVRLPRADPSRPRSRSTGTRPTAPAIGCWPGWACSRTRHRSSAPVPGCPAWGSCWRCPPWWRAACSRSPARSTAAWGRPSTGCAPRW